MTDLIFPLSALAVVMLVAVPALTVLSRLVLARRQRMTSWADFGDATGFAWLLLPSVLPLVWLLSATLHQLEPAQALAACRVEHLDAGTCLDALMLAAMVAGLITWAMLRRRATPTIGRRLDPAGQVSRRVTALAAAHPTLRRWPVWVIDGSPQVPAVFTFRAWRPVLVVQVAFARAALAERDADRLLAALLHEAAHAASRDVMRWAILRAALWLNPAGWLLRPDAERWRHAREAACDRDAVRLGADPLALAQSLVRAAGLARPAAGLAGLCGHDAAALRLRVQLLLSGAALCTGRRRRLGGGVALLALALVVVGPHVGGAGLLDHFHHTVESWTGPH